MAPSDSARHALYAELERVLGSEHADTLMAYLPQHPSDEATTKADLQNGFVRFEEKMDLRLAALQAEFARVEEATRGDIARMEEATRSEFARFEEKMDLRFAATETRLDRIDDRFDRLEDRIEGIGERMERMQRFYVGTTVWSMTALTAIFSLVVTFFR